MCPDRQIVSLYIDEELPSPWKEKMEAHLQSCPKCQAELARYRQLGDKVQNLQDESLHAAQERVWNKLNTFEFILSNSRGRQTGNINRLWRRTITLPLPVAAAALVLIAFTLVFTLVIGNLGTADSMMADNTPTSVQEWSSTLLGDDLGTILPTLDMDDFLQYILNQDEGDFVVVRLPETSRFSRTGQPALINAADYSRSRMNR